MNGFHVTLICLLAVVSATSISEGGGEKKTELQATGWASLKGTVTLDGDVVLQELPNKNLKLKQRMAEHKDAKTCLAGSEKEVIDQAWMINKKNKGIANVLVWLKPPAGTYLPVHKDDRVRKDPVIIDQPHCAFVPHVAAVYASYFDGTRYVKTGERLKIRNSAPITHNVKATGNPLAGNSFNWTLAPAGEQTFDLSVEDQPLHLKSDFHPWMTGWVGVFGHPYFAVTKDDGTYAMPRVPTGVEVSWVAWHEVIGYIYGKDGQKMTFQRGFNQFNCKVVAKQK